MVRQWIANPLSPVRIWVPPIFLNFRNNKITLLTFIRYFIILIILGSMTIRIYIYI